MPKNFRYFFVLSLSFFCTFFLNVSADAAVITWDNEGGDSNWSTCANWTTDSCPGSADVATFDATSDTASTIDAGFAGSVLGVDLNTGYNSTVTQAAATTLLIGDTDLDIAAGAVTMAADGVFNINDDFIMTAGTFNAGGTIYLRDDWTHTVGGTFNHSNGTVVFDEASDTTMNVNTTETFYNFTLNKDGVFYLSLSSGDSAVVVNLLTLTNGRLIEGGGTSRLKPQGDVVVASTIDSNTLQLEFTGSGDQNFDLTGAEGLIDASVTVNKSGGTLTMLSALTLDSIGQDFLLQSGSFDPNGNALSVVDQFNVSGGTYLSNAATLDINGDFTLSGGTFNAPTTTMYLEDDWTHTAGGTYNHSNGTIVFDGAQDTTINVDTNETFYNLTIDKTTNWQVSVSSGDSLTVTNQTDLLDGRLQQGGGTSRLYPLSDLLIHPDFDGGSLHLEFTGTNAQNFDLTGAEAIFDGLITINKTSGTVTLLSDLTLNASGQDLTIASGTLDPNGNAVTVEDQFLVSGGVYASGAGTLTVNNDVIISAGTFNAPTTTMYLFDDWTHTAGGTFNHNDGVVEVFSASDSSFNFDSGLVTSGLFSSFTANRTNNWQVQIASGDTMTLEGNLIVDDGRFTGAASSASLAVEGNVDINSGADSSTIDLKLSGGNIQSFDLTGGEALWDGHITIDKSGGQVNLLSALTVDDSGKDFIMTNGVFNLNGYAISVNGTGSEFTVAGGSTLKMQGGETITANDGFPTLASGWTAVFDGTGGPYTLPNYAYHHLTLEGSGAVFKAPSTRTLNGNLTIGSGATFSLESYDYGALGAFSNLGTLRVQGSEILTLTMDTDSGAIEFVGDADAASDSFPLYDLSYYDLIMNFTDSNDTLSYAGSRGVDSLSSNKWLHWALDDGSGSTASDSSGNGLTGTLTNMDTASVWEAGSSATTFVNTGSVDFDGVNDYIEFTSDASFVDRSVSLWFRSADIAARQVLYAEGGQAAGMNIYLDGGNVYGGAWGGTITDGYVSGAVSTNTWTNVIITYDSDGSFTLYVDGVSKGTATPGGDMPAHSASDALGAMVGDTQYHDGVAVGEGNYFTGEIDDFRIYSTVFTANEISTLAAGRDDSTLIVNVSTLTVANDLTLSAGTFLAPATINLGGNFAKGSGNFTHNSGTVTFTDAAQTSIISGSTTFNNLKTTTASKAITFTAGTTQTVAGLLTLTGADGSLVTLRSSASDSQWGLNVSGTSAIDYVDVKDSDASPGSAITHATDAARSTDSGNNLNWSFNDVPTVSVSSTVQVAATKNVSVVASVDDPDDDTTVSLKLEYSIDSGANWAKATVLSASTSSLSLLVDNDATYQVGASGGYIDTASGAQTVTVLWDADADTDGVDISTAQLRLTPFDSIVAGSVSTGSAFNLDLVGPTGLTALVPVVSSAALELNWTRPVDSSFSHYEIYYSPSSTEVDSKTGTKVDQTVDSSLAIESTTRISISDTFSAHYVKVYAFDSFGNESTVDSVFVQGVGATGGGGGGGSSSSSSGGSSGSSSEETIEEVAEVAEEIDTFDGLGVEGPDHWSNGYVKNLGTEVRIVQVAASNSEFLTLLIDMVEAPDNKMTRGEALYFLITLAGYDTTGVNYETGTFTDVNSEDDYADSIQYSSNYGLVDGYPDGSFQADRVLNRAEALKLCFQFFQVVPDEDLMAFVTPFVDVDVSAWYYPYLVHAVEYGVIEGYQEDMTFRPAQEVSYSELLKIATLVHSIENAVELASELSVE